ncbi:hypothetical protein ACFQFC_14440 [Amorphoplanes digitatis]|uniref:Uncharacterized protein n=1 Tax=Actinoplanes digitatis TaxID=1868 RepID=A0A7W7I2V5_9ACTN|nr:hypothetical protein [Actinoplanes digitatis]MBB4765404.1 hypothetical protein [Actinoplanes digitatis]GID93703.1 hypothetical protein Adi01nite_31150 [Actinoplanes digitatis]
MAIRWWASRRQRVLERAAREQAYESDAARRRLLRHAAQCGGARALPRQRTAATTVRV